MWNVKVWNRYDHLSPSPKRWSLENHAQADKKDKLGSFIFKKINNRRNRNKSIYPLISIGNNYLK